jgi:N-acetylmuramoyl-L-alanine amidase
MKQSGNYTLFTIKTTKLQGYKISQSGEYLLVKIGDPRKIYKNIIVLDAGHGGKDYGASHNGTHEKNINYKIIYTLAKKYFDSSDSTVKAYWSRYDDTFISLSARAAFAQKVGADLFVSLHMNSSYKSSANGMEVYYSKDNNTTSDFGLTSQILARRMHNRLNTDLSISSRGVKKAGFYVIKHNTVPAILIELGFLSGSKDYSKLTSSAYQKKAAQSIYQCITDIFKDYPTDR